MKRKGTEERFKIQDSQMFIYLLASSGDVLASLVHFAYPRLTFVPIDTA